MILWEPSQITNGDASRLKSTERLRKAPLSSTHADPSLGNRLTPASQVPPQRSYAAFSSARTAFRARGRRWSTQLASAGSKLK